MTRKPVLMAGSLLLALLAVLFYGQYTATVTSAKKASVRSQLFALTDAIDRYRASRGRNPDSLAQLVSEGYLRGRDRDVGDADFKRLINK